MKLITNRNSHEKLPKKQLIGFSGVTRKNENNKTIVIFDIDGGTDKIISWLRDFDTI